MKLTRPAINAPALAAVCAAFIILVDNSLFWSSLFQVVDPRTAHGVLFAVAAFAILTGALTAIFLLLSVSYLFQPLLMAVLILSSVIQINLRDAVARRIEFTSPEGKVYRLNPKIATLIVRPRGWHLYEKHILVDGKQAPGAFVDFGLYIFHNHAELKRQGTGPYFYLPKTEVHLEARLWAEVFRHTEARLALAPQTIKATLLIEVILAAFEMDEILWELRDYIVGVNCGRWDYIFSFIKKFSHYPDKVLPDRAQVTMTTHFHRAAPRARGRGHCPGVPEPANARVEPPPRPHPRAPRRSRHRCRRVIRASTRSSDARSARVMRRPRSTLVAAGVSSHCFRTARVDRKRLSTHDGCYPGDSNYGGESGYGCCLAVVVMYRSTHSGSCPTTRPSQRHLPRVEGAGDPLIGRVLDGKFRMIECVGRGAYVAVYRAEQIALHRDVAIKVLYKTLQLAPIRRTRLRKPDMKPVSLVIRQKIILPCKKRTAFWACCSYMHSCL